MNEPIYTMHTRKTSPYFDFVRMFFRMNRISDIVLSALVLVGVGYSIFLMTQPVETLSILVFVTIGVAAVLLLALLFLLPLLNRVSSAKTADQVEVYFYEDRLVAVPAKDEESGRRTELPYKDFDVAFQTKHSLICIIGKRGVIFSKDSGIPEEVITRILEAAK